jgi:hypothetical protein
MNILENIKAYFNAKSDGNVSLKTPEGVCPNCWGKQEWDGEYYKFMKGQNANPSDETYTSFVQNIARNLDKITIKESTYTCETCQIKYESS